MYQKTHVIAPKNGHIREFFIISGVDRTAIGGCSA